MPRNKLSGLALTLIVVLAAASYVRGQATAQDQATAVAGAGVKSDSSTQANSSGDAKADVNSGTKVAAELTSAPDARTAKPGDEVIAKVTKDVKQDGRTVIHKGDRLVGHVTDVQGGAAANAGSRLAVTFDQLQSGSSTFQLNSVLSSVFSARSEEGAQGGPEPMPESMPSISPGPSRSSGSSGGGLLGGVTSSVGSTVNSTVGAAGSAGGVVGGAAGVAQSSTAGSSGRGGLVAPLSSIRVRSDAQGSQDAGVNSVLSARHGDVRLESGTRMEFRVTGTAETRAGKTETK
jgi:hypothetical protein